VSLTFSTWRRAARPLLLASSEPGPLDWAALIDARPTPDTDARVDGKPEVRLPREVMRLLDSMASFRHPGRWELMFRLAWRIHHRNPRLLEDAADPDVAQALSMDRAVRRDVHKMHAFVRFRERPDDAEIAGYFAWFEPRHHILRRGSEFFVQRFPNMRWTIATPDGAAIWNREQLSFIDAPQANTAIKDSSDDLWRTYYRSICNVARINPAAMQREMPKHYWRNLPEASEIGCLVREGAARLASHQSPSTDSGSALEAAARRSLIVHIPPDDDIQSCRRCDLWKHATQAVSGRGPAGAKIMLVGEQPGDQEDLVGEPFVGPAGKLLDEALEAAGIHRDTVYITNAVKHFKWEPRGKRRLHKRPDMREIEACGFWLSAEISRIQPGTIVALGASALRALTGRTLSIDSTRRTSLMHPGGANLVATYHPSAILRAQGERAEFLRSALIEDLRRASA
jgi:uracil-DNA glycosylase